MFPRAVIITYQNLVAYNKANLFSVLEARALEIKVAAGPCSLWRL